MAKVFKGQLWLALDSGSGNSTYSNGWTATKPSTANGDEPIANGADCTIGEKSAGDWTNGDLHKMTTLNEVTGKIQIEVDETKYDAIVAKYTNKPTVVKIVNGNSMVEVDCIYPSFAMTAKLGSVIDADITFSYKQEVDASPAEKKFRIVKLTT